MEAGNLLVQSLGEDVDVSGLVLASVLFLPELQLGEDLVGERRRHDERGVASGATQVEKTTFSEDNDTLSVGENELVNLGLDGDTLGGLHQTIHVNFVIEVANVSDNGVVLHLGHVLGHEDSLVTGAGDEDISCLDNIVQSLDGETFHASLEGTDGVNLGDGDDATAGTHRRGAALSDVSVSANDGLLSGKHNVGGTHNTVRERVLAPVKVVEFGLGDRVVDIDGREKKSSGLFHGVETVDTSGGFLGNTLASLGDLVPLVSLTGLEKTLDDGQDNLELGIVSGVRVGKSSVLQEKILRLLSLMDEKGHVTTIIDDDVRSVALAVIFRPGDGVQGALPVLLKSLALPGEDGGGLVTGDSGSGVVLGREDVARAPADISSELLKSLDEDGSLDRHVERSRDTGALERFRGPELFTAGHKTRHLDFSEFDIQATGVGKGNISDCDVG